MITIHYQFPGDPVDAAQLMFGIEFQRRNPGRYIAVFAGGEETRIPIPDDEIVCDQCNAGVGPLDPCVNTAHSLYCWSCGQANVVKHRVITASDAAETVSIFLAVRRTGEAEVAPDLASASNEPTAALRSATPHTQYPIVGVAQFDHVATHYI